MPTSPVTPQKFLERLSAGKYNTEANARKALGRAGTRWNKETQDRAYMFVARYFRKGSEALPEAFWPGVEHSQVAASGGKKGKKSKKKSGAAGDPTSPPSSWAVSSLAEEVDTELRTAYAEELFGPDGKATVEYLHSVVSLHKNVIECFDKAKNVDENVDTSEVQGVINSLSQVAALVTQEAQRGMGVMLKHLPSTRTPVNNGVIVQALVVSEEPVEQTSPEAASAPATNIPSAFQMVTPAEEVSERERASFARARPPFMKPVDR